MFSQEVMDMLIKGIGETLYMTLGATIFGYVLGLPMGILMTTQPKTVFVRMQVFTKYWMLLSILDEASRF